MEQSPSWEADRFSAIQEIPPILWNRKFITTLTNARHLSLFWAKSIKSRPPSQLLKININIILPSTPGSSKLPFLQVSPPKPCIHIYICDTCTAYLILLDLITRLIFDEEYRSLNSSLWSFLYPLLPHPIRPKYFPQHPVFTHPQPTFLPQCEWPCFPPIKDNKQN
jgi:hypothetical protein